MNVDSEVLGLVHDYVLECRGQGHCLPKKEVDCLLVWIQSAASIEELMLSMDELLPQLFESQAESNRTVPVSLLKVHKKMLSKLQEFRGRNVAAIR